MRTVVQQISRAWRAPKWLKQAGALSFVFFLAKGLAWLAAAAWLLL